MESIYKSYSPDQLQELFSNFLIDSWSYSKVTSFARNEKAFEMQSIFGLYARTSSTTIAGNAYHTALELYFNQKKEGKILDLVALEAAAFEYIDDVPANKWKLQKTTPTIESAKEVATKTVSALLRNFVSEKSIYEDDIKEILHVELYCDEFLTVNGVDIPLPCHMKIDLVVRTMSDKIAVVDHKSKKSFTDDDEVGLAIGIQAITYVLGYEARFNEQVNEVWFVENKYSQNKDKSAQLIKFPVEINENSRRLYEALLYEPLKRMVEAVSNPDYIYLINDSDNYVDKAELYDFWARTMICEVDDFNVEESKKQLVSKRLKKIRDSSAEMISPTVIKKFKENASKFITYDLSSTNMTQAEKIEHVLRTFGTQVRVAHQFNGFSSATFLLEIGAGVKIGSIFSRRLDIANALDVENVRIAPDLKVYEGKSYIAIDFKKKREGRLDFDRSALVGRRIPMGVDNFGNVIVWDWDNPNTPHALVCGGTGSGKSVWIRNVIECAVLTSADRIVILDPKNEFTHLSGGSIEVCQSIPDIEAAIQLLVDHMNNLVSRGRQENVIVIFDEFADAAANARSGNELKVYEMQCVGLSAKGLPKMQRVHTNTLNSLEENMRILAQKGRSVGFRIVSAMQRASTKIITGDAKVNFPVQICFRVQKEIDSKVVLDEAGAEGLAGYGDGLIKSPEYNDTIRFQSYYLDPKRPIMAHYDEEVNATIVQ
jgi:DNA segregation ATPase FtsK/SpoIIIE, S-DNA-T family